MVRSAYDWRRELFDAGEFAELTADLLTAAGAGNER